MAAPLTLIETSNTLPAKADTVVIGGGIIGVCTAYWLARAGQQVVLLEKGRIGAEQSSRNWGWCRQQNRDARELPLSTLSLALWEEMQADLGGLGFARCGLLYLSNDEAELGGLGPFRARPRHPNPYAGRPRRNRARRGHSPALARRRLVAQRRDRRPRARRPNHRARH